MALNPIIDARDVRFILFEMLKVDELNRFSKFADFDRDTYEEVITLAEKIAVGKVYPINQESDKLHAQYNPSTKEVKIPEGIKAGLSAYYEAGYLGLPADQELGGTGMPLTIFYACMDFFTSGSVALAMYPVLSMGALNMYIHFMEDNKRRATIVEKMLSGEWGGTMCLTEPDAGSDVGALKTKAVKNPDGTYNITGQKIFISSGDNDFYKNMVHPVLARIEGDPAGTKGISIFMVPKYWINEDGSLGGHNDVICSGIEHKMGITASATCTMNFGDEGKCRGIIIGQERQGMKIMFQMMNEARLFVGSQGCSVSSAAYMHAVTYARNRVQGVDVTQMMNPDAKGVAIINHPDVKRMLLLMKSKVEAMRTLDYYVAQCYTIGETAEGREKEEANALVDFLIPITKAGNTDTAWEVTSEAIQTYGGYGFCSDYPVEQYARDAKILAIYEGTNGIQSMDLAMRKILMNKDQYNYNIYKNRIAETIAAAKGIVDDKYLSTFERAIIKMDEVIGYMKDELSKGKILGIFANATPLQQTLVRLTHAWMHLWALTIVKTKMKELVDDKKGADLDKLLKDNSEAAYYTGRVLSGEFYLGAEFQKFFGCADYILSGETAVTKASSAIFTGALEE